MEYADKIRRLAPGHNPRHVAAWLLIANGPDALRRLVAEDEKAEQLADEQQIEWLRVHGFSSQTPAKPVTRFEREVELAIDALRRRSPEFSERLAKSSGL